MKIILLGYMGSGKSTLGKALAKQKKLPFIDLDHYIEQQENTSIKEIFKEKREIYFRQKETFYLETLLKSDESFVLAVGGGTPCFGNNMQNIIKATKNTIYLKYSPQALTERLRLEKNNRPLIADIQEEDLEEFIRKHLFERNLFYSQANHIVVMDGLSLDESLEKLNIIIDFKEGK